MMNLYQFLNKTKNKFYLIISTNFKTSEINYILKKIFLCLSKIYYIFSLHVVKKLNVTETSV